MKPADFSHVALPTLSAEHLPALIATGDERACGYASWSSAPRTSATCTPAGLTPARLANFSNAATHVELKR
jgi:hypothetical protein